MPGGRGPAPQEKRSRERDNYVRDELPLEGYQGEVPPLPGADGFTEETCKWYWTWARSPQAVKFGTTDWQRLHMMAPIVDEYFRKPNVKLLAEIRLQEASLGATPADRLRLHWKLADGSKTAKPAGRQSSRTRVDPRLKLVEGA